MNKFLSHKFTFEVTAFFASLGFVLIAFLIFSNGVKKGANTKETEILKLEKASPSSGLVPNYNRGLLTEMMLMSSLSRPNQISLFGSSEFSSNENSSYIYLTAEHQIPVMGFGHAFHQSFSIYCELLAGNEYLKDSKIVIFLSPGWFETEGTNPEAFLEFVPPHFLEKIWMDETISKDYKVEIGRYISKNADKFSSLTHRMQSFKTLYESEREINLAPKLRMKLQDKFPLLNSGQKLKYDVQTVPMSQINGVPDFKVLQEKARKDFFKSCRNNKLFVDSAYYVDYVLQSDGSIKNGSVTNIPLADNAEYKDFALLLKLLKEKEVNCSFVIQTLNPHYYHNLSEMNSLIRSIVGELENANYPYLNMFTSKKEDYQPGVLTDIMHLGNLGWMQVNEFIFNTYVK